MCSVIVLNFIYLSVLNQPYGCLWIKSHIRWKGSLGSLYWSCNYTMANDIFYDRWQIVVHGGIDGYSRKIMYLKASTNNKASTVFSSFLAAINEFGLPERFRCEKGTLHVMCCVLLCVSLCELRSKDHNEKKPFCAFSIDSVPVLLYCILKLLMNNSINQSRWRKHGCSTIHVGTSRQRTR